VYCLKVMKLQQRVRSYETRPSRPLFFKGKPIFSDEGPLITDKASHSEATEALAEAESERDRDEVLLGCAFDADAKAADTFARLARYETCHQRSLFRILNELRQMQKKRLNRRSCSMSDAVTPEADDTQ
jgi:hypothetical protein